MFPSRISAAAILILLLPLLAVAQPRTVVPWIAEELRTASGGSGVGPLPEPGVAGVPATDSDERLETVQRVAADLHDSAIGVADLAPIEATELDPAIWDGVDPAHAEAVLRDLRLTGLRSANLLLRDILLTPPMEPSSLPLVARVEALLAIGAAPEALRLAFEATHPSPAMGAATVRAALLVGRGPAACERLRASSDRAPTGLSGVFCHALSGQVDRAVAQLEVEIAADGADPLETALLDAVIEPAFADQAAALARSSEASDFAIGLLAHLGLAIPDEEDGGPPAAARWLAASDETLPARAAAALASLESDGLTKTRALADAYGAFDAQPEAGAEPDAFEAALWSRMLGMLDSGLPDAHLARLVEAGLQVGRRNRREGSAARLLAPGARSVFPTVENRSRAGVMQRVFLLADEPDRALVWLPTPPPIRDAALFVIAGAKPPAEIDAAAAAELANEFTSTGDPKDGRLLASLAAFGQLDLPEPLREAASAASGPDTASRAEAAVTALDSLAGSPIDPGQLFSALERLRGAGFEDQARQIAIEAILLGE